VRIELYIQERLGKYEEDSYQKDRMRYVNVYIEEVLLNEEHILRNMFEFYDYEFSQYLNFEVDKEGLFRRAPVTEYLSKDEYKSFFIKSTGTLLGFVIVKTTNSKLSFEIEQFFILKKYNGKGIGKQAAIQIFDRFKGNWKVTQVESNYPAQEFWRNVIRSYSNNSYRESNDDKRRSIQEFNNA
jgi:predicted acetyltransferase